jgi:hypothetical protein
MAAKKKPKAEEAPIEVRRAHALAICIGFNELAKLSQTLGEKMFHRLARDNAVEGFVALGGNADLFAKEDGIVTIEVPGGPPHIVLHERDIALMRQAIAEHDGSCSLARNDHETTHDENGEICGQCFEIGKRIGCLKERGNVVGWLKARGSMDIHDARSKLSIDIGDKLAETLKKGVHVFVPTAKPTICGSLSSENWDDEDSPPVKCSKDKGHRGKHEGGTRCGTISWR